MNFGTQNQDVLGTPQEEPKNFIELQRVRQNYSIALIKVRKMHTIY